MQTYWSDYCAVASPDNSSGCYSCCMQDTRHFVSPSSFPQKEGVKWCILTWCKLQIPTTFSNTRCFSRTLEPQNIERGIKIFRWSLFIPICWGYESFSGGLEKSATLAIEIPHLKVGAQKWTAMKPQQPHKKPKTQRRWTQCLAETRSHFSLFHKCLNCDEMEY
jgi:hypothetical protein